MTSRQLWGAKARLVYLVETVWVPTFSILLISDNGCLEG